MKRTLQRKEDLYLWQTQPCQQPHHPITQGELSLFADVVGKQLGLHFSLDRLGVLHNALCRRMAERHYSRIEDYLDLLKQDPQEPQRLGELLVIHETRFFRSPLHFAALKDKVIPDILKSGRKDQSLRLWSAGCSTGEEAYSLVITALEALGFSTQWEIYVLGTDISEVALTFARRGEYSDGDIQNVPSSLLQSYFVKTSSGWKVIPELQRRVEFRYLNLIAEPFPFSQIPPMDVIFCQNVLIYFKPESTRRVLHNFLRCLKPGGYLFLGFAEGVGYIPSEFQPKVINKVLVYQRPLSPENLVSLQQKTLFASASQSLSLSSQALRKGGKTLSPEKTLSLSASPNELLHQARELWEKGSVQESLDLLNQALSLAPDLAEAYCLGARILASREDYSKALEYCEKALALAPMEAEVYFIQGQIHKKRGESLKAEEAFRRVLYLNPQHPLAPFELAYLLHQRREDRQAEVYFKKALQLLRDLPSDTLLEGLSAGFLAKITEHILSHLEKETPSSPKTLRKVAKGKE